MISNFTSSRNTIIAIFVISVISFSSVYASVSLNSPINLSNSGGFGFTPKLISSGSDVHVVWDEAGIKYINNTNNFAATPLNLDAGGFGPQIAASGSDVHIVWYNAGVNYINNTGNFAAAPLNLDPFGFSPKVAASGSDVHIVWENFPGVNYKNNTANFAASPLSISATGSSPQIAATGSSAAFSWQDFDLSFNTEVKARILYNNEPFSTTILSGGDA